MKAIDCLNGAPAIRLGAVILGPLQ
jgi:hypothetical protein